MKSTEQKIACPICGSQIIFNAEQLLAGVQFSCPECNSSIGLAAESKPILQDALEKIDSLKKGLGK